MTKKKMLGGVFLSFCVCQPIFRSLTKNQFCLDRLKGKIVRKIFIAINITVETVECRPPRT